MVFVGFFESSTTNLYFEKIIFLKNCYLKNEKFRVKSDRIGIFWSILQKNNANWSNFSAFYDF